MARCLVAAPFLAVLLGLVGQLTVGRAIIWTADSFGFVYPGLLMAAGADATGQLSGRNIGYPWLASLVLPLGGLRALVTVQSVLAAAGLSALLLVLRTAVRGPLVFCGLGLLLVLAAYASDSFVVYAQTINGDSLFGSLLAVSLWLFLSGWRAEGASRIVRLTGALAVSYTAFLVKPNGVLTLGLCIAALAVGMVRAPRSLLAPRVLGGLAALALAVFVAQSGQARLAANDVDFGPRVLFCGHLDAVAFDLGSATPQRRALKQVLDRVRADPRRWPTLGYNADLCYYGQEAHDAIHAAARSEGLPDGAWMSRRFALSTLRHPRAYVLGALRQVGFFLAHPNLEADLISPSQISDWDWDRMARYQQLLRAPRAELDRPIGSWMAQRHILLAHLGKHLVGLVIRTLAFVALTSLLAAAIRVGRRRRLAGALELAFVSTSGFLAASVLSVALSFTFDIPRYAASFAPLTYLWWLLALTYLAKLGGEALASRGAPLSAQLQLASDGLVLTARWPDLNIMARRIERTMGAVQSFALAQVNGVAAWWGAYRAWINRLALVAPFLMVLLYWWMQLRHGSRLLYTADSFGYVYPGMLIASGEDVTSQLGGRNIGYPLFSALVLPWRGFPGLVTIQVAMAALSLGSMVALLRGIVRPVLLFSIAAILFALTVVASDSFVLNAQSVNGEAGFGAGLSLAMALFLLAWTRRGPTRAGYLLGALAASYVTWLFKPNAVLTLPLCAAGLGLAAFLDKRALLKPSLLIGAAAFVAFAAGTYILQSKAQPRAYDFGTRVLYCGHIDVVLPELGSTTPERRLAQVLDSVRHAPPQGWFAMGYDADGCFYGADAFAAIHAAATASGLSDKAWMSRQFQRGVLHRPQIYAGEIWRQVVQYFRYPDGESDLTVASRMSDSDWPRLLKHPDLIGLPRSAFDADVRSWFVLDHQILPRVGKAIIAVVCKSLGWVTAAAALLALANLARRWRRKENPEPELLVLASAAFMLAVILTTAISFTFDVGRYASSFAPTAFAWWTLSAAYLVRSVWRITPSLWALVVHRAQSASNAAASGPFTR